MDAEYTPCDFERARYSNIAKWRDHWSRLHFILGIVIALFIVATVVLFLTQSLIQGATTFLGTLVSGRGMKWVERQRAQASEEEDATFRVYLKTCGMDKVANDIEYGFAPAPSPRILNVEPARMAPIIDAANRAARK